MTKTPTNDTEFTIPRLTSGDEYQFRVTAENKAGPGKPSEPTDTVIARPKFGKFNISFGIFSHHIVVKRILQANDAILSLKST